MSLTPEEFIQTMREGIDEITNEQGNGGRLMEMPAPVYAMLLRRTKPACFALCEAGWRAGYTVNGLSPRDGIASYGKRAA